MMQYKLFIYKEKCDTIAVFICHSRSTAEGMSGRGKEEGHGGEKRGSEDKMPREVWSSNSRDRVRARGAVIW